MSDAGATIKAITRMRRDFPNDPKRSKQIQNMLANAAI
jgi:hypothetical protein